jgi:hypothetical protein
MERCMKIPLALRRRLEPECIAVAHDIACARPGEMAADRERLRTGKPLAHDAARFSRLPLIQIDGRRPVEMRDLTRMVKDITE